MTYRLFVSILLSFSFYDAQCFAATPFVATAELITAILTSESVTRKVTNSISSVRIVSGKKQMIVVIATKPQPLEKPNFLCETEVSVENKGDGLAPKWVVTKVESLQCRG